MFNEDIIIDRNALEEECSRTPAFFDYWQTQEANLKVDLENLEAELSSEIRSCDESELKAKHGISKLTEGAITSAIRSSFNYKSLRRQFLQAEANRKAYDKKITLLDTLAKLHGQGYFSKIESKKETRSLIASSVRKKIEEQIKARKIDRKPKRQKRGTDDSS